MFYLKGNYENLGKRGTLITSNKTSISTTQHYGNNSRSIYCPSNDSYLFYKINILSSENWTVDFWTYAIAYSGSYPRVFSFDYDKDPTDASNTTWLEHSVTNATTSYISFFGNALSTEQSVKLSFTRPAINSWHHYEIIKNGNIGKLYLDNVHQKSITIYNPADINYLYINNLYTKTQGMQAYYNEFKIWNYARY